MKKDKKKAALREELDEPKGKNISKAKLKVASKKGGKIVKRAILSDTLSKFKK